MPIPTPFKRKHPLYCRGLLLVWCSMVLAAAQASPSTENTLNIQQLTEGQTKTLYWRGFPVRVYKRSAAQIARLNQAELTPATQSQSLPWRKLDLYRDTARKYGNEIASLLLAGTDPLENSQLRSQLPAVLVVLGTSTSFGCAIEFEAANAQFVDPCSGAHYGLDGRIIQPTERETLDLLIPVHQWHGDTLTVGDAAEQGVTIYDFAPNIMQLNIAAGEKLLQAIEWKKPKLISELLKDPSVLDYHTVTGATAIHLASAQGAPSLLAQLHNAGFRLDVTTSQGVTPLMMALLARNAANARWLVEHGASTECQCNDKSCSASEYLQQLHGYLNTAERQAFLEKAGLTKAGIDNRSTAKPRE